MTPKIMHIYAKEHEKEMQRQADLLDYSAWLNGLYVFRAICAAIDNKSKYPEERFGASHKEAVEQSDVASIRFGEWAKAFNKNKASKVVD